MQNILQVFIWLPLVALFGSLIIPRKKEKALSFLVFSAASLHLGALTLFILNWIFQGSPILDIKHIVLYQTADFEFFIDFYFDSTSAVFSFVGSLIILLVSIFSRFYMHRDGGFKRFFCTLLLFFLGYNLVVFGGNFETLFIGWEILGFCSFLLISFYRDRYLPVKNALKVISVYRLGDVCLMLAMWLAHHLFHQNITFNQLNDSGFLNGYLVSQEGLFIFISVMVLIAAAAKSAMLPFSSWLPRAMEGPTTSSAVFYGSLSLHLGAFLLIRTYPIWENLPGIKIALIVLGIATSLIATAIARVQSTVKTQIAYASITQVGLIFVEVALGFHTLALIHFAGNSFLRTYQLLVSPSVLHYRIHDMFFNHTPNSPKKVNPVFQRLLNAVYVLSIKEWNLDGLQYRYLWQPFKWVGRNTSFMVKRSGLIVLTAFFSLGLLSFEVGESIPAHIDTAFPLVFAFIGLLLVLTAFAERGDARRSWWLIFAGQGFFTLSIAMNEHVEAEQLFIYLGAVIVSAMTGHFIIDKLNRSDGNTSLNRFHGHAYDRPVLSFIFLLCCLATIGFPFTPTFLGIDLLFTHIGKQQYLLITLTALGFIFIELAVLRIYARLFMGPHKINDHPIAYRSS